MGDAAERTPTFEELYRAIEALPPGLTGEILEPGVIRTMGRPGAPHRFTARRILGCFGDDDAAEGGTGWWFESEAEIRFPGDRLAVPDLSAWRLGPDAPAPPSFVRENPIVVLPQWCGELLSPRTRTVDRNQKLPLYAESGVEWVWLVDPEAHRVEVLQTVDGAPRPWDVVEGDITRALPPFESVVDVSRWWLPEPEPDE
jgi:Uma2 family endonuclease